MRVMSRRGPDPFDDEEVATALIATECEAFLAGDLAELRGRIGSVPVWVWLNEAAHGDPAGIATMAGAGTGDTVEAATKRTIARAILADGRAVTALQHDVLVPLELEIAGDVMTPRRLVELVGRALFDVS